MEEIMKQMLEQTRMLQEALAKQAQESREREERAEERITALLASKTGTVPAQSGEQLLISNLSLRIEIFNYSPEEDLDFQAWYKRYGALFEEDGKDVTDAAKACSYRSWAPSNITSSWTRSNLSFEATVKQLQSLFAPAVNKVMRQYQPVSGLADSECDAKMRCDQLEKGIIELVQDPSQSNGPVHYLPHRAVIREDKETTKVRIVMDGSAKPKTVSGAPSLNDCLFTGPILLKDLTGILLTREVPKEAQKRYPPTDDQIRALRLYDNEGLLRAQGRIDDSLASEEAKRPLYLPREDRFTHLLICYQHKKSNHYLCCMNCKKFKLKSYQQPPEASLPAARSTPARPFEKTGTDYFGFLRIKEHVGSSCFKKCDSRFQPKIKLCDVKDIFCQVATLGVALSNAGG
ncbi:hypothetical protein DdX_20063 [Ditylenchus destructor]|uniref:DUF7083 domain-containing protein n=1 Tax=Ditylenchus destructor TaxID=166010 RepID=A0AAD4MHU9_9BILA|nr:hypothetical protein DdX_20063 [Ditylenchus destructor]